MSAIKSLSSDFVKVDDAKKVLIDEIVTMVATSGLASLAWNRAALEEKGAKVRDVPPLQFLAYIFSTPELKAHMPAIADTYLKWSNFIYEIGISLGEERKSGIALPQIKSFAELLGADAAVLQRHLEADDIDGFIKSLL